MSEEKTLQLLRIAEDIAALDPEEFQYFKGYQDGKAYERRKAQEAARTGSGAEEDEKTA